MLSFACDCKNRLSCSVDCDSGIVSTTAQAAPAIMPVNQFELLHVDAQATASYCQHISDSLILQLTKHARLTKHTLSVEVTWPPIMLRCCRSIHKPKLPATEPLLLSLFGSLPSMPTKDGAGSLPYTVAVLIGTYSDWLAETLRPGSQSQAQGQVQGPGQAQGQLLVSQLLQLLMQCMRPYLGLHLLMSSYCGLCAATVVSL